MPAVSKHTRNFTVLLLTSLGIITFLLLYIFDYIPDNERRINARNYRVLQRVGENMSTTLINYATKVGDSYVSDAVKKTILPLDVVKLHYNRLKLQLQEKDKKDRLTGKFGIRFKFLDEEPKDSSQHLENDQLFHYLEAKGTLFLDFPSRINKVVIKEFAPKVKFKDKPEAYKFDVKVPVDSMLSPLMRWDTFTHLIVLRREEPKKPDATNKPMVSSKPQGSEKVLPVASTHEIIIKQADAKAKSPFYEVVYNSRQSADLVPLDTLGVLARKAVGAGPANVSIAGVSYKIYTLTQRVGSGEKWYLFGTIPAAKFENESRAIPADTVSFSALAFVILLMAFPFLKLVLINQRERLYAADVVFSFLSLFVGLALIILLLFNVYAFYGIDRTTEQARLKSLASSLAFNMREEINLLLTQTQVFDSSLLNKKNNTISISSDHWKNVIHDEIKRKEERYFPNIRRVFWIDAAGMMITSWTAEKGRYVNNAKVPVSSREYFKTINSGGGWTLTKKHTPKFALESITSFADGEKYAVISTKSQHASAKPSFPVVALATKLTSLYKPILPPGYGFCVIDKAGNVLFHQNEDLNLNENLLEETNSAPHLKAALYGQTPAHFFHNYQGSMHQLYVKPLEDLPLFMVTYVNEDFHKGFNVNLLVLTAMFLSLYLFSLAFLSTFIILFNKGFRDTSFRWLWPKKNNNQSYATIIVALAGIILLTLFCTSADYQISSFFIFILAAIYILMFIYSMVNKLSFLKTLRRSWLVILILNVIGFAVSSSAFVWAGLFQVAVLLLLFSLLTLFKSNVITRYRQNKIIGYLFPPASRSLRLYVVMIAGWLVLASGLPAFTLFRVAYHYEADLVVRYNQMYLAQALNSSKGTYVVPDSSKLVTHTRFAYTNFLYHTQGVKNEAPPVVAPKNQERTLNAQVPPPSLKVVRNDMLPFLPTVHRIFKTVAPKNDEEALQLNSFVSMVRPVFRNILSDEYYLKSNEVDYWQYVAVNTEQTLQFNYPNQEIPLQLNSHLPKFEVPAFLYPAEAERSTFLERINKSAWFFWFDMLLLLVLLYLLLSFVVKRLFNSELIENVQRDYLNTDLLHPATSTKLFLVALPQAQDIKEIVRSVTKKYGIVFAEFDLNGITKATSITAAQQKLRDTLKSLKNQTRNEAFFNAVLLRQKLLVPYLIVKNFDYDPFSKESLEFKISLLHELNQLSKTKIILQSTLHPSCWEERLNDEPTASKGAGAADSNDLLQEFIGNLSNYTKIYQSLKRYPTSLPTASRVSSSNNLPNALPETDLQQLITTECAPSAYLEKEYATNLRLYVRQYKGEFPLTREKLIRQLQSRAQLYYRSLWDSCSEEEHYFLYDMAQDGLVNSKNVGVLSSLLGKGLLITGDDGLLKIMNESFRSFILTAVDPNEALRFERSKARGSSWEVYKTPLVLILVGAVLFFFFTQKSSWANIIAILTAMSTFLSILPRLSFLVPSFMVAKEAKTNE